MTSRASHEPERVLPGLRASVLVLGLATAFGAAAIAEAAATGMPIWWRFAMVSVLGLGVAALVRVGLIAPLIDLVLERRLEQSAVQAELDAVASAEAVITQTEEVLAACLTEPDVLRVLSGALRELASDREYTLLIGAPEENRLAWQVRLSPEAVGEPEQIEPTACRSFTAAAAGAAVSNVSVVASTAEFDTCPHAVGDELTHVSSVCLPVPGKDGPLGVVWSTGGVGDVPSTVAISAMRRLVALAGHQLVAVGARARDVEAHEPLDLDPLTEVESRRAGSRRVMQLIGSLTPFTLAICDIDQFGEYNDHEGLDEGDRALITLAQVLKETTRPGDFVCRMGDDAFLVILPRCSIQNASAVMERLRENLVLSLALQARATFTCSVGVAESVSGATVDLLFAHAEAAMNQARIEGGNRVRTPLDVADLPTQPSRDVNEPQS